MASLMRSETLAAPDVVAAQAQALDEVIEALTVELRARRPVVALTVARGSSDHAANYLSYLTMKRLGVPVVSLPPSLVTMHQAPLAVVEQPVFALSQSGASPDLVETISALQRARAITAALVNHTDSALARTCRFVIPLLAGEERSVAATKTFIAQLAAAARIVGRWQQDASLLAALAALPEDLRQALSHDWARAFAILTQSERAMVVGRGLGWSVALEAALKLKETSGIQAEAFSSAEIRHGPLALVEKAYPVIVFALRGPEQAGMLDLARDLRTKGARVILVAPAGVDGCDLPVEVTGHQDLDPIAAILSFYLVAEQVARARGRNPDEPHHLQKVTHTR